MSRSTQTNIESALRAVDERESEFGVALQNDAEAKHRYEMKQAQEFLDAEGTVDARKAIALKNCDVEYLDYLKKKAVKEFTREKLKDAQDALSARQSLLKYEAQTNFGYTSQT